MQDLVDKLQGKVKSYKRQCEEAVSARGSEDACGHLTSTAGPRRSAARWDASSRSGLLHRWAVDSPVLP